MREPSDRPDSTPHEFLSGGPHPSVILVAQGDEWTERVKVQNPLAEIK
ncbi:MULTISPECIES: hypothetical protein [unclassified Thioalkalivibrio]|nr:MULTISPECIES: hypothetical protein [unclassified Thioalkalivibrio]